jgi:hypothetical protein
VEAVLTDDQVKVALLDKVILVEVVLVDHIMAAVAVEERTALAHLVSAVVMRLVVLVVTLTLLGQVLQAQVIVVTTQAAAQAAAVRLVVDLAVMVEEVTLTMAQVKQILAVAVAVIAIAQVGQVVLV